MGPHTNDGLGENIGVETVSRTPIGDGLAAPIADAACQALEDPRTDFTCFSTRMKHDSQKISSILRESDQGFRLGLNDLDRIGHFFEDLMQAGFEFSGSLFGQFAKEREFVREVKIESAGGIPRLLSDLVARHGVWAKLCEETESCIEQSTTSRL